MAGTAQSPGNIPRRPDRRLEIGSLEQRPNSNVSF